MRPRRPLQMILWAAVLSIAWQAKADSYTTDETGRRFRVQFDPASQLRFGFLSGVGTVGPETQAGNALETGLAWRSVSRSGKHGDEVRWQLDHRFAWGYVLPWTPAGGAARALDATVYSGSWLRHADANYLMLPTEPPKNIYFPLDIGIDVQVGRARLAPTTDDQQLLRVGVARASVLLDPLRSNRTGNSLEFGFGARYDIDLVGTPNLQQPDTVHRLAPFTATSLRFRWQDASGLTLAELYGSWFPHWCSESKWATRAAEGSGRFQRVLVAVNDQPIALVLDASYFVNPPLKGLEVRDEFRVQGGLSFGLQLR